MNEGARQAYFAQTSPPCYPKYRFSYEAEIDYHETYEMEGQTFADIYVVTMELDWGEMWGALAGGGFSIGRVVMLTPDGEPLAIFGDGSVSRWIS